MKQKGKDEMKFALKSYKRMNSRDGAKSRMRIAFALVVVLLFFAFATSTVHAGGEQSITRTIQPSSADSYMYKWVPTGNYGSATKISVQSWATSYHERGITKFDLSGIPSGAQITSATLSLYLYQCYYVPRTIGVHKVNSDRNWIESQVTWNSYKTGSSWTSGGGDFAATATDTTSIGSSVGWYSWSVTDDVLDFVNNPSTNYGWIIKDENEGATSQYYKWFCSREYTDVTARRPKLEVTYTAPWDSHKTSYSGPICDIFSDYGTEHTVYMNGTGFKEGSYDIVYWDGGGNKRVTDGAKSVGADGILNSPHTFAAGTDIAGTWYASVYVGDTPTAHSDTTDLWADDSFTVEQSAIPEFPAVIAAIAVCMLCAISYILMRRKVIYGM